MMKLEVYSRRWGHNDAYTVKLTDTGWNVSHVAIGGACDKRGMPYLFENLDHDSINYPESLGDYLTWLWEKAAGNKMNEQQIQEALIQIGHWICETEKASPSGIFAEYK
ncbi:MAG: hypothetical protein HXX11_18290 [Desulfuromonadales bacterium]|nr:hypothetical protein [Desulfuromonadales bacterium]